MMPENILFTDDVRCALLDEVGRRQFAVLTDSNVAESVVKELRLGKNVPVIVVESGEESKSLSTLGDLWEQMSSLGMNRDSMLVNIGGGVVTDLGGFAAATYMRGIPYVNVPTSLLAMVDASVGGKTAVNVGKVKNLAGVFESPIMTIICADMLKTLPKREILSGLGEMLKHALIRGGETYREFFSKDLLPITNKELLRSISVKAEIVERDPYERGERAVLNLGHTAGHALESLSMVKGSPISHGHAVAQGLVVALVLSRLHRDFPTEDFHRVTSFVRQTFGSWTASCNDREYLLELMSRDKKNRTNNRINFILLDRPGKPVRRLTFSPEEVGSALDIAAEMLG